MNPVCLSRFEGDKGPLTPILSLSVTLTPHPDWHSLAIIADIGQTYNTSEMIGRMMKADIDAVNIIGDFTYADNYDSQSCMYYSFYGTCSSLCLFYTGVQSASVISIGMILCL